MVKIRSIYYCSEGYGSSTRETAHIILVDSPNTRGRWLAVRWCGLSIAGQLGSSPCGLPSFSRRVQAHSCCRSQEERRREREEAKSSELVPLTKASHKAGWDSGMELLAVTRRIACEFREAISWGIDAISLPQQRSHDSCLIHALVSVGHRLQTLTHPALAPLTFFPNVCALL